MLVSTYKTISIVKRGNSHKVMTLGFHMQLDSGGSGEKCRMVRIPL